MIQQIRLTGVYNRGANMYITPRHIINWMQLTAKQLEYQKKNLTQLDQFIGDGDHGINMNRGFKEVEKKDIIYSL